MPVYAEARGSPSLSVIALRPGCGTMPRAITLAGPKQQNTALFVATEASETCWARHFEEDDKKKSSWCGGGGCGGAWGRRGVAAAEGRGRGRGGRRGSRLNYHGRRPRWAEGVSWAQKADRSSPPARGEMPAGGEQLKEKRSEEIKIK